MSQHCQPVRLSTTGRRQPASDQFPMSERPAALNAADRPAWPHASP